jgi:hypothetical protein
VRAETLHIVFDRPVRGVSANDRRLLQARNPSTAASLTRRLSRCPPRSAFAPKGEQIHSTSSCAAAGEQTTARAQLFLRETMLGRAARRPYQRELGPAPTQLMSGAERVTVRLLMSMNPSLAATPHRDGIYDAS